MTPVNEAKASRAMDAAVARAMGRTIYAQIRPPETYDRLWNLNDTPVVLWQPGMSTDGFLWADDHPLLSCSAPDDDEDRAALLDAVLWLGERRVAVTCGQQKLNWWALREERVVGSAPGDDLAAYALCVCRAVLTVAGVEEVEDDK